jgi:hypothetical protein
VPFAAGVSVTELGEHPIDGRIAPSEPTAVSDDIGFPAAIYAPPVVALETENPQPAVVRIVSAVTA